MHLCSYGPLALFQLRYSETERDQCAFDVGKKALLLELLRNNTDNGYVWDGIENDTGDSDSAVSIKYSLYLVC